MYVTPLLSDHFSLQEALFSSTAIRLGIDNIPSDEQLQNMNIAAQGMEKVRELLGTPIKVDSWLRVEELNKAVGGAKNSAHMDGFAVDFISPEFGYPIDIARKIVESDIIFDQIIMEGTWCHISFAPAKRKSILSAKFINGKAIYSDGLPT